MPNEQQYLSVRKFAAAAGVSPQSIYKAVDNRLSTYCKRENGVITISAAALSLYGCQPVVNQLSTDEMSETRQKSENQPETGCQPVVNPEKPENISENPEIELLRETITTLQNQLTVKDKQIEQLTAALSTALTTANAAQALHAGAIQAQLTAGEDNADDQSAAGASPGADSSAGHAAGTQSETPNDEKPKQGLFYRIFGKNVFK